MKSPRRTAKFLAPLLAAFALMLGGAAAAITGHLLNKTEVVDSNSGRGQFVDIAIGPNGPAVAYWCESGTCAGQLLYTEYDGEGWTTPDVIGVGGRGISLAFDPRESVSDEAAILFIDDTVTPDHELKYVKRTGGVWGAPAVVSNDVRGNSRLDMAIGVTGDTHIAYLRAGLSDEQTLAYGRLPEGGGPWEMEIVDALLSQRYAASIAVDSTGLPHIAHTYRPGNNSVVGYSTRLGLDNWEHITVDQVSGADFHRFVSLAMNATGDAHVAFQRYDGLLFDVMHSELLTGDTVFSTELADAGEGFQVGYETSIALNVTGEPRIAHVDTDNQYLEIVGYQEGFPSWVTNDVDIESNVNAGAAVAVDVTGESHVAYYDSFAQKLMYFRMHRYADVQPPTIALRMKTLQTAWTNDDTQTLLIVCSDNVVGACSEMKFQGDVSGDWMAYSPEHPWVIGHPPDGFKNVSVEVKDTTGNVSGDSIELIFDSTPPTAAVLGTPTADAWVSAETAMSWTLPSEPINGSGLDYQRFLIDGSPFGPDSGQLNTLTSSTSLSGLSGQGLHTWMLRAYDRVGLFADSETRNFNFDSIDPSGAVSIDVGSEFSPDNDIGLSIACSDSGAGCSQMRFTNFSGQSYDAWQPYATADTWTLDGTADGVKTVYIEFMDNAGNTSVTQDSITVDTTAPVSTLAITGGDEYTNTLFATLDVSCVDVGIGCSGVRFSNDSVYSGGTLDISAQMAWSLEAGGDGPRTVWAEFTDAYGVTGEVTDGITVDTVDPSGTVTVSGDAAFTMTTDVILDLSCSDDVAGCAEIRFSNDGVFNDETEDWVAYSPPTHVWTLTTGDATKTVYVEFKDAAGNSSAAVTDDIDLDTQAPDPFSLFAPSDGAFVTGDPTFDWLAADDANGIEHYELWIDDGLSVPGIPMAQTQSTPDASLGEGAHTWYVKAFDEAGNSRVSTQSWNATVDLTPPVCSLLIEAGDTYHNSTTATLNPSCSDGAGSGMAQMRFSNDSNDNNLPDDGNWSSLESYSSSRAAWTLDPSVVDIAQVFMEATDASGNPSIVTSDAIIIDTTPPASFTLISPADDSWTASGYPSPTFAWNASSDEHEMGGYQLYVTKVGTVTPRLVRDGISSGDTSATAEITKRIQLLESNYNWFVRATDAAGNTRDSSVRQVGYDATKPVGTIYLADGSYAKSLNLTLSVLCDDNASGCASVSFSSNLITWSTPTAITDNSVYNLPFTIAAGLDRIAPVYYKMLDEAGNGALAGDVQYALIHLDRNAPTAGAISTPVVSSDQRSTKVFRVTGWKTGAKDPVYGSGIASYDLRWRYDGGSWKSWKSAATGSYYSFTPPSYGRTYCFAASARDNAGNVGTWGTEQCTVVALDDRSTSLKYSSDWTAKAGMSGRWIKSIHRSAKKGASVSLKKSAKKFYVIASKTPSSGKMKIYVNGSLKKTVDLYSATNKHRQRVYSIAYSTKATRTIKVVVTQTKNSKSKGYNVDLDAIGFR